ncbi:hypothetical protein K2173_010490 [Erythroxylum novogranatense]|uniref:Enhancer of mRNA-decapping protein 4 n=1 Tax=Erythroxylum novogranatense TaxID=1862640 RepID=A0AAV8TG44_9ROSI|nr:hypothetical protein K2173_010490 [Erythroxylum novogranatense]
MASPTQFDMNKLFMSTTASTTTANPPSPLSQGPNLPITLLPTSSYPPPTGGPNHQYPGAGFFQYPPPPPQQQHQFYHHHLHNLPSYPPQSPSPTTDATTHHHPQRSLSFPTPPLQPQNPNPNPNPSNERGAEIMALLRPSPNSPSPSPPPPPGPGVARMPSSKMPRGRRIDKAAPSVVYDVDMRLQGEVQPQLEVTPITKYTTDPQLCLGRQIAVNKSYISYGLKQGNIRILNINTALRSLFRTHSQRVTDMTFFADDVHLLASAGVDGRINVWKISEGSDEEDKPQITGNTVIAIQIIGESDIKNPRVCWHCYKQEILVVGVGKRVLRIDTNKVGKGDDYSPEAPLQCHVDKLIDGIQLVGKHDGEVTDLSMCQWMTTRLVSASMDGMIKIWEDLKASPLAVLRPHDGLPVYSSIFLTAAERPDHIILVTAGPQNQEIKVWASDREEGWLLPSDADSLNCIHTLELQSSAEPNVEEAFFNQVVSLSQGGLLLLANAKKNAIYVVHLDYGPYPAATRFDYISEFTVKMPILSLTGTSDVLPGQCVAQIYCVQTQAIQQYTLDLCQCLPPPLDNLGPEKESVVPRDGPSTEGFAVLELSGSKYPDVPISSTSSDAATLQDAGTLNGDAKGHTSSPTISDANVVCGLSSPLPLRPMLSRDHSEVPVAVRSESGPPFSDQGSSQPVNDYPIDRKMDEIHVNVSDVPSMTSDSRNEEKKIALSDDSERLTPVTFKHPTLVTPEMFRSISSSDVVDANGSKSEVDTNIQEVVVNSDAGNTELEVKVVDETRSAKSDEFGQGEAKKLVSENKEKYFCSQASDLGMQITREFRAVSAENYAVEEPQQLNSIGAAEFIAQCTDVGDEEVNHSSKDVNGRVLETALPASTPQLTTPSTKGKKQKGKNAQASGPTSPSPSTFNSIDSYNEVGGTTSLSSVEPVLPQIVSVQETLNQLVAAQKEMQKQMSNMVAVPISKECRKLEAALGKSIEKAIKSNTEALWARFQEENAKNDKLLRERTQQISNLISSFINKDLATMLEKAVKKELSSVGPVITRTVSPVIEKTISSAITESFQRGVGDKAVNQLDKSVNSKLEATVARQIQAQFQTSGKQALQDSLKAGLEASLIPAFEMTCKAMFEQVNATFRMGMEEHTTAAQQHFDAAHSSLALALREALNSVSSITQTLSGELADGQRKLLTLAAAGANSSTANPLVSQLSNGPLAGLHEKVETHLDPTKELSRLVSERKYEEAFTIALQRSDVSIVSWLCSQVDLSGILSLHPMPLSQGVLLSLLQQLACDLNKDTAKKVGWMTDVGSVINPADPMIAMHVRPIVDQVYQIIHHHQRTCTSPTFPNFRVLVHVINSILSSCK